MKIRNSDIRIRNSDIRIRNLNMRIRKLDISIHNSDIRLRNSGMRIRNLDMRIRKLDIRVHNSANCSSPIKIFATLVWVFFAMNKEGPRTCMHSLRFGSKNSKVLDPDPVCWKVGSLVSRLVAPAALLQAGFCLVIHLT